ncbi:MAG: MFS transporter [Hyphomicrobiales bacterium]
MNTQPHVSPPNKQALSFVTLAAYGLPALPLATLALVLAVSIPTFYSSQIGLSLTAVGATLLFLRIFDAFIDPLIGVVADRTTLKFGRRRSFVALAMPLTVVSCYHVFVPPADASIWYLSVWMVLLSLGMSAMALSYAAWGAELATDYAGRNRVSAFRQVSILLGTLVATVLPVAILSFTNADKSKELYVLALFVAIFLPAATLLCLWKVPEPQNRSRTKLPLKAGLKAMWQNKPFLRLITAFAFNSFANGLPVSLFLFYVADVLGAKEAQGWLLLTYFLCGMIGVPLWVKCASYFGKHQTWCVAMLIACVVFAFAPLLGRGDVVAFAIITVVTGLILGADLIIPSSIQADVIDVDTANTGEQRSGVYFAAWSVATQLSLAGAVGLAFPMLDWAGFDAVNSGALPNGANGLFTLAVLYGWVPVVLKLIAISLMWSFPLNQAEQEALKAKIEAANATSVSD